MLRNFWKSLRNDSRIIKLNRQYKNQNVDIRSRMVDSSAVLSKWVRLEDMATIVHDVTVGDYSFVGSTTIGKHCSIGRNGTIGGYEHLLYDKVSISPILYRNVLNVSAQYRDIPTKTIIRNDVWNGNRA